MSMPGGRDLSLPKALHEFGCRLVHVQVGWKGVRLPGWNDPSFDPPWSGPWADAGGKARPGLETWLRDFRGNVGLLSGRAPRLASLHPPFEYVVVHDLDAGHLETPWARLPEETRRAYEQILDIAERNAIYFGRSVSGDGRTAVFLSARPWVTAERALVAGEQPLVQVFGVGRDGKGVQKLIPPSRVDPSLAPDEAQRARLARTEYETIIFDLSAARLALQEAALDGLAQILGLTCDGASSGREVRVVSPASTTNDVAEVLARMSKLPNGQLHREVLRRFFGPENRPNDGHGSYPGVVLLCSALAEAGATGELAVRLLGYTDKHADFWRAEVDRVIGKGEFYTPTRETLLKQPIYAEAATALEAGASASQRPVALPPLWVGDEKGKEKPDRAAFESGLFAERQFVALRDSRELRIYDEARGFYVTEADTYIAEWVRAQFTQRSRTATRHFINEIVAAVRDLSYRERGETNPPWQIVVRNGVLNIKTGTLRPHSADPVFTFGLPVRYDPSATCPRFDAFLERSLPNEVVREAILEFAGYLLWPGQPLRKLLVNHGPTTTGKSTFADVVREVFGPENISSVDLAGLADRQFKAAELVDKIANIRADIPWKIVRNVGLVQEITGGRDVIEGERKYQHPFSFRPSAKLVFSCNRLPPIPGATPAFWVRVYLMPWDVKVPKEIDQHDYSVVLLEERDGIFRRFFEASARLMKRGHLPVLPVDIADRWVRSSDPALWVAQHELEGDLDGSVELDAVVARVDAVAEEENVEEPPSPRQVAAAIRRVHSRVRADRPRVGDERRTVYRGVRWLVRVGVPGDVASNPISDVKGPVLDTYISQPSADAREKEESVQRFPDPSVQNGPFPDETSPGRHVSDPGPDPASREGCGP